MQKGCFKTVGRSTFSLIALTSVLMLSGCLVGPDYQKPIFKLDSKWSGSSHETPSTPPELANWWQD